MKRLCSIFFMWFMCAVMLLGNEHMQFRSLPIDGNLKSAIKEVKKWGFMGMKMKNVGVLMGTLDNEEVMITLLATHESQTLFSVVVVYEGSNLWGELLTKYEAINATVAAQYGDPVEHMNKWEAPYSIDNHPIQAFKEGKAVYGSTYNADNGNVIVNVVCIEGKMGITVTYLDAKNQVRLQEEGGVDAFTIE